MTIIRNYRYKTAEDSSEVSGLFVQYTGYPQLAGDPEYPLALGNRLAGKDSLGLSVAAPQGAEPGSRPLLIYTHGGNFLRGAGLWDMYDPSEIAQKLDCIVAVYNYRLGLDGWDPRKIMSGSFAPGEQDQIDAISSVVNAGIPEWDRENLFLIGHSAGAAATDRISNEIANRFPALKGLILLSYPADGSLFEERKVFLEDFARNHDDPDVLSFQDAADREWLATRSAGEEGILGLYRVSPTEHTAGDAVSALQNAELPTLITWNSEEFAEKGLANIARLRKIQGNTRLEIFDTSRFRFSKLSYHHVITLPALFGQEECWSRVDFSEDFQQNFYLEFAQTVTDAIRSFIERNKRHSV